MGVSLSGPDSLISNTLDSINKVSHDIVTDERYEMAMHSIDVSDHKIVKKWKETSTYLGTLFNSYRLFNITSINYGILSMFGYLLVKLTTRYHKLYTRSSILATIATNVVLYGISDTLAQSITQFLESHNSANNSWTNSINNGNNSSVGITLDDNTMNDPSNLFADYGDESTTDLEDNNIDGGLGAQAYTVDLESHPDILHNNFELQNCKINFNFRRFFGFVSWGFIMAFIQVGWYMFLNAMFTDMPTLVSVLERDLTDQLLFSPISLACFFAFTTIIIEKGDSETYKEKMYKLYVTTLAVSVSVWFPVQFINFSLMPKKFQVPFSSSIGVIWNCYLSFRNASASQTK